MKVKIILILCLFVSFLSEAQNFFKEGIELIQAQNFSSLRPTLKRAGTSAEINYHIIIKIKPKGFRRIAQKDDPMTVF